MGFCKKNPTEKTANDRYGDEITKINMDAKMTNSGDLK
jgi:hypothetical protein